LGIENFWIWSLYGQGTGKAKPDRQGAGMKETNKMKGLRAKK